MSARRPSSRRDMVNLGNGAPMTGRELRKVLIVDDDAHLRTALRHAFLTHGLDVTDVETVASAMALLDDEPFDLIVVDVRLPDGTGADVVRAATACAPMPLVIAISGRASPTEAFEVASSGARAYLEKPVSFRALWEHVERARDTPPSLDAFIKASVGHVNVKSFGDGLRVEMMQEAVARSGGNVSQAAKLLGVTRQAVQQSLRRTAGSGEDEA